MKRYKLHLSQSLISLGKTEMLCFFYLSCIIQVPEKLYFIRLKTQKILRKKDKGMNTMIQRKHKKNKVWFKGVCTPSFEAFETIYS